MIAWWWIPVALAGVWVPLVLIAAGRDREVATSLEIVLYATVAIPLYPVVWLLTRLDVGAVPLDPRALSRFAAARSSEEARDRPAWVFFVWHRGIVILRKWEVVRDRPEIKLSEIWAGTGTEANDGKR